MTNEKPAVEHVYTHVWGIHMVVLYTITAVQICSVQSVVVLVFDLAWVKSIPIFCLSAETLCPLFCPYGGFSSVVSCTLRR